MLTIKIKNPDIRKYWCNYPKIWTRFYHWVKLPKDTDGRPWSDCSLVNTVCQDLSVQKLWIITAVPSTETDATAQQNQQNDVRLAKTKISLGIRSVWSEPSLSAWRQMESLAILGEHSEDSDQAGGMPRLIWVFAGRTHSSFCWFCHVAAQIGLSWQCRPRSDCWSRSSFCIVW